MLRGTVADYGLADVLQLIARGGRSGRLRTENDADAIEMHFASATVVEVRTGLAPDGALGSRLVRAGLLTEDRLGRALAERASTGRPIASILTASGELDARLVRQHATLLRWDMVLAPFTWTEGRYAFADAEVHARESWAEPLSVDLILMKGLRLVEEWPRAIERVPSRRWVVARRVPLPPPAPKADFFSSDTFEVEDAPDQVSDEARSVHSLAAPGARISRLFGQSPFDRYETTLALAELVERGFVVLTPP